MRKKPNGVIGAVLLWVSEGWACGGALSEGFWGGERRHGPGEISQALRDWTEPPPGGLSCVWAEVSEAREALFLHEGIYAEEEGSWTRIRSWWSFANSLRGPRTYRTRWRA